ncbi:MAG: glycosyltransferase [Oligoflexia bacterium]|nr:glycosyltransferase [Oligoflexia bacterium]
MALEQLLAQHNTTLSIVVPLYNETPRIDHSIDTILNFLKNKERIELLYVDDGSTDNSLHTLQNKIDKHVVNLNGQLSNIKINFLRLEKNQGKGGAIKTGVLHASNDYILYTDFDFAISLNEIEKFLHEVLNLPQKKGIVIASRKEDSSILKNQSLPRKIMGRVFNFMMKCLVSLPVKDTQCGFKLFDKKTTKEIFPHLKISGFAFDVEILKLAYHLKIPVIEKGVEIFFDDQYSTINIFVDPLKMLFDLFKLRVSIWKNSFH